jgi:hypothetical protein
MSIGNRPEKIAAIFQDEIRVGKKAIHAGDA